MSSEFVLEGTLLRVLQVSRLLGAAPLNFRRKQGTVTASVSYTWYMYSCVFAIALNLLALVLNYMFHTINSQFVNQSQLFVSLRDFKNVIQTLSLFLGSFTSYRRMKSMAVQINALQTVFRDFKKKSDAADRQNKMIILVLILILLFHIMRIVCTFYEQIYNVNSISSSIAAEFITICMLTTLVLQEIKVVLIHVKVAEALNILKMHLKLLLRENRSFQAEIRRVGRSYIKLYEVVSESNTHEGGVILLMFASIVVSLVCAGFVLADDLNNLEVSHLSLDTVVIAVPALVRVFCVIIFTRSCHQVHKQVTEISMVVSELVYLSGVWCETPFELYALIHQLDLVRPVFSVLGIFTVTQSTLTTILSAWVTYTVILIQVRSNSSL